MIKRKQSTENKADESLLILESALEHISDYPSNDAESAAHVAIIQALWTYVPTTARKEAAAAAAKIATESEYIRY